MRYLTVVVVMSLVARFAVAQDDATQAQLAKTKSEYATTVDKAKTDLIAAFDARIKEVAQTGNLDNVKNLMSEKNDFETAGKLPTSSAMKSATTEYQASIKKARDTMTAAYDNAVATYTKALKIDKADSVNSEFDGFKKSGSPSTAQPETVKAATQKLATKPRFEYKFYFWKSGDPPVKMIQKDEGFCYFAKVLDMPSAKDAELFIGDDGFWYLTGAAIQGNKPFQLSAVAVKINGVAPVVLTK